MDDGEPNIEINFEVLGSEEGRNSQKPFPQEHIWNLKIIQTNGGLTMEGAVRNPFPESPC